MEDNDTVKDLFSANEENTLEEQTISHPLLQPEDDSHEIVSPPSVNTDAEEVISNLNFEPQPNIQTDILSESKQEAPKTIHELQLKQSQDAARERKAQDIKLQEQREAEKTLMKEQKEQYDKESQARFQAQLDEARQAHKKKYTTDSEVEVNLMKGYDNNYNKFISEYEEFEMLVSGEYNDPSDKLDKLEKELYNRLMKGKDNASLKGNAKNITKGTAARNVAENEMLHAFIRRNTAMEEQKEYVPPKRGSMLDLTNLSSSAAEPVNEVKFSA